MKKYAGFNLLELLVAIAISAAVITAITSSYGSLLSGYTFNNGKTQLYQSMRLTMNLIKRDLQNAGTFGSYSLHNSVNNAANTSFLNGNGAVCISQYCLYNAQAGTLGVGVYGAIAGTGLAPLVQGTTSETIRMQFGGNKTAYYAGRINGCSGGTVSVFNFNVPVGNSTTASSYVLASTNRAYLINLPNASSNDSIVLTNCTQFPAITVNGTVMTVPDQATMVLVPLITRYYFVKTENGKQGLYVVTFDGTNAIGPTLVSSLITNLSMKYIVDTSAGNFNHVANNNTYRVCPTSSMVTAGNAGNCVWNRVIGVIVTLTGQVNSGAGGTITQSLTDSVGWAW